MDILTKTFIKNLGKGRAWYAADSFTQDFFSAIISPFKEIKKYLTELQYVHFPQKVLKEENVINGENLFDISPEGDLESRANNVAIEWLMLAGNLSYKTIEKALNQAGYKVIVYENPETDNFNLGTTFYYGSNVYGGVNNSDDKVPIQYGAHSARLIGNGLLNIEGTNQEPVKLKNGKHTFYVLGRFTPSDKDWEEITNIILKMKRGTSVAICQIEERKIIDNDYYNVQSFADYCDGGTPFTTDWFEKINS
ncbi:TPA: hypothetical protein IAA87_05925 [Candidatus Avigastranaerophilus faecigallinarum]|nr:hypothetical protein [Candidatus Avigastranaerophilus faecigallinarum]